jgi:hypothetical protein
MVQRGARGGRGPACHGYMIQPPNASCSRVTIVIMCETNAADEPDFRVDAVQCEGGVAGTRSDATLDAQTSSDFQHVAYS